MKGYSCSSVCTHTLIRTRLSLTSTSVMESLLESDMVAMVCLQGRGVMMSVEYSFLSYSHYELLGTQESSLYLQCRNGLMVS